MDLLTRDDFRAAVFARDAGKCVVCKKEGLDVHHIIERRLWPDGGYYIDNGATLCGDHHLAAETTAIQCDDLRSLCGITRVLIPPHLYADQHYDKWGNPILSDGRRLRGELFDDPSVQKVLSSALHLFTNRIKYPRTYHLPFSPGNTDDDRAMANCAAFDGEEVIVTIKMDGEQTTIDKDGFHARSLETTPHPSRDWIWGLHRRIGHEIGDLRICGENTYAKHSIHYHHLPSHFMMFSVWDQNMCLSWDVTTMWAELLGLQTVPVYWRGIWDINLIRDLKLDQYGGDECEGYVVRVTRQFHHRDFSKVVGKYVRANHVNSDRHWMRNNIIINDLEV